MSAVIHYDTGVNGLVGQSPDRCGMTVYCRNDKERKQLEETGPWTILWEMDGCTLAQRRFDRLVEMFQCGTHVEQQANS